MQVSRKRCLSGPRVVQKRRLLLLRRLRAFPRLGVLSFLVMLTVVSGLPVGSALIFRTGAAEQAKWLRSQTRDGQASIKFGPYQKLSDGKSTIISPVDQADLTEVMSVPRGQQRAGSRVAGGRAARPRVVGPKVPGALVPLARVPGSAATYLVLSVEFESPASLASFKLPGVTIFAHKDKFADVFVEPKQVLLGQLRSAPGVVRLEAFQLSRAKNPIA